MSERMSISPDASQFDGMVSFVHYHDDTMSFTSPPPSMSKTAFARHDQHEAAPAVSMTQCQPMSGPSHNYDMYKQQTGLVPGAIASTLAVNQLNQVPGYAYNLNDYLPSKGGDVFDFNTDPSQGGEVDMDFESPSGDLFFNKTIHSNSMCGHEPNGLSPPLVNTKTTINVGRMWPGMHQQAALAKAPARQRQRQQTPIQQQQQLLQRNGQVRGKQHQRTKSMTPADPLVEHKITQLLNSMRANSASDDNQNASYSNHMPKSRKDEENMDEDERLLASEEGKRLSSKERRQLRNKVSARAFRSRRKEYITQLETEIANKVTENGDLQYRNRALVEENKRLSDLTRMLLSSPSFSDFLKQMSVAPQQLPVDQQQAAQPQRQVPKDMNLYATQQQQISTVMIPEQSMDLCMLSMNGSNSSGSSYQPHVYAVLETPEMSLGFDTLLLLGKTTKFVGSESFDDDERLVITTEEKRLAPAAGLAEAFERDAPYALYHSTLAPVHLNKFANERGPEHLANVDLFGGIEFWKASEHFELMDATREDENAALAVARVQLLSARLEGTMARLELLISDDF